MYEYCRENMVGGPSIVFHRYHEVGERKIREELYGSGANACGLVQGYDANALHAHCVAQPQPVDHIVYCEWVKQVGGVWGHIHGWSMSKQRWSHQNSTNSTKLGINKPTL